MTKRSHKLDELAERAGVSPRTVRYYIQRGLLTAPAFRGPDTAYGPEHLAGLRAIKRLQDAYWPLDAIASALAGKSTDELERIASGELEPRRHGEEPQPAPTPPPTYRTPASPPQATRTRQVRIALAPGLTLTLDEDAPHASSALAEAIARAIERGELR